MFIQTSEISQTHYYSLEGYPESIIRVVFYESGFDHDFFFPVCNDDKRKALLYSKANPLLYKVRD